MSSLGIADSTVCGGVGGSGSDVAAAFDDAAFVGVGLRKSVVVADTQLASECVLSLSTW
jgi:hypothetical protein